MAHNPVTNTTTVTITDEMLEDKFVKTLLDAIAEEQSEPSPTPNMDELFNILRQRLDDGHTITKRFLLDTYNEIKTQQQMWNKLK